MEIWHRIAFNGDSKPEFEQVIEKIGVDYKITPLPAHKIGLVFFDISESHNHWFDVAELIKLYGASDIIQTVFDKTEILASPWLRLIPTFEHGYPQPQDTWVCNPINYDYQCHECGIFHQSSNFCLKAEPKLGKNDFMKLIWGSALFCTDKVLRELENHHIQGYEIWKALIYKTNQPSQTVQQLLIPAVADSGLTRIDDLKRAYCSTCHTTKYYPHMKGMMCLQKEAIKPNLDIFQTDEWFGDGHTAYREIIVSNKFAKIILEQKWKGVALKVVELV